MGLDSVANIRQEKKKKKKTTAVNKMEVHFTITYVESRCK